MAFLRRWLRNLQLIASDGPADQDPGDHPEQSVSGDHLSSPFTRRWTHRSRVGEGNRFRYRHRGDVI